MVKRDELADAVLTCTSSISSRLSRVSSFSFKDANLLFVVASNETRTLIRNPNIPTISSRTSKIYSNTDFKIGKKKKKNLTGKPSPEIEKS